MKVYSKWSERIGNFLLNIIIALSLIAIGVAFVLLLAMLGV